jgi:hypothetical protein
MDPDACFSELLEAIAASDFQDACDHAENLLAGLDRGGFAPGGGKLRLTAVRGFCTWVKSQYPMEK